MIKLGIHFNEQAAYLLISVSSSYFVVYKNLEKIIGKSATPTTNRNANSNSSPLQIDRDTRLLEQFGHNTGGYRGSSSSSREKSPPSIVRHCLPLLVCRWRSATERIKRSRVGSPQWQYGRPVRGPTSFCPRPTGFLAHTASLFPLLYACPRAISSPRLRLG